MKNAAYFETRAAIDPEARSRVSSRGIGLSRVLVPFARACYSIIFISAAPAHFSRPAVEYAASQGVPLPGVLVPASGVLALMGGLSVLLGYRARVGAWMLVAFLVPVTLAMHNFWAVADPQLAGIQKAMFFKNVALLGGALLIAHFGSGPASLRHGARGPVPHPALDDFPSPAA